MKKNAAKGLMKHRRSADITAEPAGVLAVLMVQIECYAGIARWRIMQHKERINHMKYKLENVSSEEHDAQLIEKEFVSYHVGQVFDKKIGGDGGRFELIGRMGHINIGFTDMTEEEISVINSGKLDIFLSLIDNIAFITAVFDNRLILDMPFHAGLYPEFNIENPMNHGYFVPIIAVDNRDNVIKAIRVAGLDPDFSAKLYSIALSQCKCKPVDYDDQLQRIYQRYTQEGIIRRAIRRNKVEGEK